MINKDNLKKTKRERVKVVLINVRITEKQRTNLKKKNISPTSLFNEALKEVGCY